MESNTKLKVSYIISAIDRRSNILDPLNYKLILTDDLKIPSRIVDELKGTDSHFNTLKNIHDEYVKYSYDYPIKMLCGFRTLDDICEVTYITSLNYIPGLNKSGRIISIGEMQDNNIFIEEYYGELFVKFGGKTFA